MLWRRVWFQTVTISVGLLQMVVWLPLMLLGPLAFDICNDFEPFDRWMLQTIAMAWMFGWLGLGLYFTEGLKESRQAKWERMEQEARARALGLRLPD